MEAKKAEFKMVLLEIVERGTWKNLLPIDERYVEIRYVDECRLVLEDRAKRSYLVEIESRIKSDPEVRERLCGIDWCIYCTVVE